MEIRNSEQLDKFSQAMLQAQRQIENADIDSDNPHFRSRYASLQSVLEACKKPLNGAGIFFIQAPVALDCKDCLGLVTRLTHAESGQWLEATMAMPLQKVDPQGMGSAITYARRYSLMAILGIAAEDDDAEAAMNRPAPQAQSRPEPRPQQSRPASNSNGSNGLPQISGVSYIEADRAGQMIIIAQGKVYPNKDQLRAAGFRWDGDRKEWWKSGGNSRPAPQYEPEYETDNVPF